ncbi:DUF2383 domain-containing protein [Candidatus Paracaedibacter symbiosus]|uniref:DUF2383 domain-containing protein n=1 Tax=Candidatus Paracaedibacter symbiosus TaxID=244582 RepID=UPI00050959C9|nr:DUF2383 domain-containing protein [Candidatus Paracaedibacter symbiosus]
MRSLTFKCKWIVVTIASSLLVSPSSFQSSHATNVSSNQTHQTHKVLAKDNYSENVAKILQELAQAEIDASFLIRQAMENINSSVLREKLRQFKQQCEEHIKVLSNLVHAYGREAPSYSRDFKGFFMQGYAAMRGLLSDKGVMAALHTNLQKIVKIYESQLNSSDLPEDVKAKIKEIYESDHKILQYVATQL